MRPFLFLVILFTFLISPVSAQDDPAEARKTVVNRLIEDVINTGDLSEIDDILASDYAVHGIGDDRDRVGFAAYVTALHNAMPDFEASLEVLIVEGDWAASRVLYSGTFENDWIDGESIIPANNEPIAWTVNTLHRLDADGRLVEDFAAFDQLHLLHQLDAAPVPEALIQILTLQELTAITFEAQSVNGTEDANKLAFQSVIEDVLNQGEVEVLKTLMIDDYHTYEPFGSFTRETFSEVVIGLRTAIPDLVVTIDALVAEGDWVAARLIYVGNLTGEVPYISTLFPIEGKPVRLIVNVFVEFDNGVAQRDFKEYNRLAWLRQVGIVAEEDTGE